MCEVKVKLVLCCYHYETDKQRWTRLKRLSTFRMGVSVVVWFKQQDDLLHLYRVVLSMKGASLSYLGVNSRIDYLTVGANSILHYGYLDKRGERRE